MCIVIIIIIVYKSRLDYRMEWDKALREYLKKLDSTKPLIYCGDLNVAHNPIGMYLVYWND